MTIQDFESQIVQLKANKNDLIKYYENKFTYFNSGYVEDKNHITPSYENKVEQLRMITWKTISECNRLLNNVKRI